MKAKETMTLLNKSTGTLETFNIHTGELVVRDGELISTQLYTVELADAICNLVREGLTYEKISSIKDMPPRHLIFAWRNTHPDFARNLKNARRDRATYFNDKAIAVLEDSGKIDREDVPEAKFKFDSYMRLAERGSPDEYAAQPKTAMVQTPATIIINTGINRQPVTIEGEVYDGPTTITSDGETEDGERREREQDISSGIREAERKARASESSVGEEEDTDEANGTQTGEEGDEEESIEEDQKESEQEE